MKEKSSKGLSGSNNQLFRWGLIGKAREERLRNGSAQRGGDAKDKERLTDWIVSELISTGSSL